MARIRTIKPEFWAHEELSALPEATHMLAAALLNYADDEGYFNANPALVRAQCSPLREPSVSVHDSLKLLASVRFVRLGVGEDGKRYGHIVKFLAHQCINRATPSKIRASTVAWEDSVSPHQSLDADSHPEGKGTEGNGTEGSNAPRKRGRTPKVPLPDTFEISERVREWAQAKGYDRLNEHYEVFVTKAQQQGYVYANWDAALMTAIREDWAKLRVPSNDPQERPRVKL